MFFSKSRVDAFPSVKFGSWEVKQTPTPPVSQVGSDAAEAAYRLLLSTLGIEESSRHELEKTPARAAKAFREMTIGLQVEYPLRLGRF
jgi:GTP cyclohydrolase I